MRTRHFPLVLLLSVCSASLPAEEASSEPTAYPAPFQYRWKDNLRWTIDSSTQQWLNTETDEWSDQYVVGLDLHKVVSTAHRDIGTLTLQPYFVWLPGGPERPRPGFFDGNEATLTWRIANFNYIVLARGRLNVRLGHFEVPFGLEQEINTNGTLRQYSNGADLGVKADWGVSVNGHFPKWQYEAGLTRGTGQEYRDTGDPYAFTARVGTPFEQSLALGFSVFEGRTSNHQGLVDRRRVGADVRWSPSSFQFMAEASVGKNADSNVNNWLAEANWANRTESALFYAQMRRFEVNGRSDESTEQTIGIGARWLVRNTFTLAAQITRRTFTQAARTVSNEIRLHVRFRI